MWISRKKYESEKYELKNLINKVELENRKLDYELKRLKALVPRKEYLKDQTVEWLYRYATKTLGITPREINESIDNKADLIKEILWVEEKLAKI